MPGRLTPRLQEAVTRLSTWIPSFAKAAAEVAWFTQVQVSADTARRLTEAAGAVAVALDTTDASRILQEFPPSPAAPDTLVMSVDGAMIPLRHGQWTEVRTLAVGEVVLSPAQSADAVSHTTNLSYFSRRSDSTTFAEQALGELHRRGIESARRVGAVVDGAEWWQQFIDLHKPDATRSLDFPHAAEYVTAIGQTMGPAGPLLGTDDLARLLHDLKHTGPDRVLTELRALVSTHPTLPEVSKYLAYLEKRVAQLQYPDFQRDGWPIGSGMVESANKLVVEDRLKGAGMHWAEAHVNPMLALRNAVCNDRWDEVWLRIEGEQRRQVVVRRAERQQQRQTDPPALSPAPSPTALVGPRALEARTCSPAARASTDARPAANHPWRKAWSVRQQRKDAGVA